MEKPEDRLNPKCDNPWYIMEQWGGKSWFCNEEKEHERGRNDDSERSKAD